jgi:ribosome-associated protein
VAAIADQLQDALKEGGYKSVSVEGLPHCDWVVLDAGDVIVHIFRPEVRSFYNIEKLWSPNAPADTSLA